MPPLDAGNGNVWLFTIHFHCQRPRKDKKQIGKLCKVTFLSRIYTKNATSPPNIKHPGKYQSPRALHFVAEYNSTPPPSSPQTGRIWKEKNMLPGGLLSEIPSFWKQEKISNIFLQTMKVVSLNKSSIFLVGCFLKRFFFL